MHTDTIGIRVDIDTQYGSWTIGAPIDSIFIECFKPIDICDASDLRCIVGGISPAKATKELRMREDAAKSISEEVAKLLLKEMAMNDTLNGYPK